MSETTFEVLLGTSALQSFLAASFIGLKKWNLNDPMGSPSIGLIGILVACISAALFLPLIQFGNVALWLYTLLQVPLVVAGYFVIRKAIVLLDRATN